MAQKFNTAEEFKSLDGEKRLEIIKEIASQGYKACVQDYTDFTEERRVYDELQKHYKRIEALAYAIGDELKEYRDSLEEDSEEWGEADSALTEFMWSAANECELQYGGEYKDHSDGFWLPSNC